MNTTATRTARPQRTATKVQAGSKPSATMTHSPTHAQIAARAFEIYMRSGCRPGQDEHNWLEAEKELLAESRKISL
jgi:hypothetical protein